jgi:hypothetical protein
MINGASIDRQKIWLFFVYPFGAFVMAMQSIRSKSSFVVFLLFGTLFGYTFIAQKVDDDAYRYVQQFDTTKEISVDQYFDMLKEYASFNSDIKDIYVITCNFIVSRISGSYHVLMSLFAFVFMLFFLKSFRFFVDRKEYKNTIAVYLLVVLFFISNPIYNINGVRFWTAAWIAVYVIFKVFVDNNPGYIFMAAIIPLVHVAFVNYVAVLLIGILLSRYDNIWVIAFIVSFLVGNIAVEILREYSVFAPKAIYNMMWSYGDVSNVYERNSLVESLPMYARVLNALPALYVNLGVIIFVLNKKFVKKKQECYRVYKFVLVWMCFVNFTMSIPSFGGRFVFITMPLISYLCLALYEDVKILRFYAYLVPFVYGYVFLYFIRNMIAVTDPLLFITIFPHLIMKNII